MKDAGSGSGVLAPAPEILSREELQEMQEDPDADDDDNDPASPSRARQTDSEDDEGPRLRVRKRTIVGECDNLFSLLTAH